MRVAHIAATVVFVALAASAAAQQTTPAYRTEPSGLWFYNETALPWTAQPALRPGTVQTTQPKKQPAVTVTIRPLVEVLRFGDPIPVEFTIRNVGRKAYEYLDRDYDRSVRLWIYQLVVETEAGKALLDPQVLEMLGEDVMAPRSFRLVGSSRKPSS